MRVRLSAGGDGGSPAVSRARAMYWSMGLWAQVLVATAGGGLVLRG